MRGSTSSFWVILLAAGIGVAGHQLVRSQGRIALPWVGKAGALTLGVVAENPPHERLQDATNQLLKLALADDTARPKERVQALIDEVDEAYASLAQSNETDAASQAAVRASALRAKYAAARLDPARYGRPFWTFAENMKADAPTSDEAANAALLQVLVKHDFRHPSSSAIQRELKEFASKYSPKHGAALYCLVAEELVASKHNAAAEKLLRQGILNYDSTPAAGTLVNQLVDLGFTSAKPRKSRRSSYLYMMRALEARAIANARHSAPASPSPRPS